MFSSQARYIPIAPIFLAAIFCSTISRAQQEPAPTPLAQASETPASPHRPTIGVALAGGGALGLAHKCSAGTETGLPHCSSLSTAAKHRQAASGRFRSLRSPASRSLKIRFQSSTGRLTSREP